MLTYVLTMAQRVLWTGKLNSLLYPTSPCAINIDLTPLKRDPQGPGSLKLVLLGYGHFSMTSPGTPQKNSGSIYKIGKRHGGGCLQVDNSASFVSFLKVRASV